MRSLLILLSPFLLLAEADCLQIPGDRIRANDLAKRLDVFRQLDPEAEIGFTPLPGSRRTPTFTTTPTNRRGR